MIEVGQKITIGEYELELTSCGDLKYYFVAIKNQADVALIALSTNGIIEVYVVVDQPSKNFMLTVKLQLLAVSRLARDNFEKNLRRAIQALDEYLGERG